MLPIEEHGFALHNGAFWGTLCLRYGWLPNGLSAKCLCDHGFTVDHAMNCSCDGFPTLRHNKLEDFTTAVLNCVRFVIMLLLSSQFCSHYLGNLFEMPQPMYV